jgi:SMC interacting uncharacterized protein involved in chromosome segregation
MWKGLFDLVKQVFTLTDAVQKTQSDVTQIKQDLRELTLTVVRQGFEIQMMRERETHEREKQELHREIERLRSQLVLPPAPTDDKK